MGHADIAQAGRRSGVIGQINRIVARIPRDAETAIEQEAIAGEPVEHKHGVADLTGQLPNVKLGKSGLIIGQRAAARGIAKPVLDVCGAGCVFSDLV